MRLSQTSLNFFATVAILGMALLNSVLLARWLGPTGRGEVAAALLWPLIIPYLGATGMIDAVVVFASRPSADLRKVLGSSLVFGVSLSVVLAPLGYVTIPFLIGNQRPEVVEASQAFLLILPITLIAEFIVELLRARMLIGLYNVQRLVVPLGYLVGTMVLYISEALSVLNVVVLQIALHFIRLAVALLLCRVGNIRIGFSFDWTHLRSMLSFAGRSHVGAVAERANSQLDQAVIAAWLPPAQLGLYVAAVSTTSIIRSLANALKITILPLIAREDDHARQDYLIVRGFRAYWTLSWVVAPFFAISLYWLIPIVFGDSFSDAVTPAIVLVFGSVVFGAKDLISTSAKAVGLPWIGSAAELLALLITAVLLFALLPTLGILGAAVTSIASYTISLGVVVKGLQHQREISPRVLVAPALQYLCNPLETLRSRRPIVE